MLESYGVDDRLIQLLKTINDNVMTDVRISGEMRNWFGESTGTRQGDLISPSIFITLLERVMDKKKEKTIGTSVHGARITNIQFVDDIDMLEEDKERLEKIVQWLNEEEK